MYYAIEIIGHGRRQRFAIKAVKPHRGTYPVLNKTYKSEAAARVAAREMNIDIVTVGDFYSILSVS